MHEGFHPPRLLEASRAQARPLPPASAVGVVVIERASRAADAPCPKAGKAPTPSLRARSLIFVLPVTALTMTQVVSQAAVKPQGQPASEAELQCAPVVKEHPASSYQVRQLVGVLLENRRKIEPVKVVHLVLRWRVAVALV